AHANAALHEAVIGAKSLPIDLVNEMYFQVEARLRETILKRNAQVDPLELDAALERSRKQVAARHGALPADYAESEAAVRALLAKNALTPALLAGYLRNRETTK